MNKASTTQTFDKSKQNKMRFFLLLRIFVNSFFLNQVSKAQKTYGKIFIFVCSVPIMKLQEQMYLMKLSFERYFSYDVRSIPQDATSLKVH